MSQGCLCQGCGKRFLVDVLVPNTLWEEIKPEGKPRGAGLLCGTCIFDKLENANEPRAFTLLEI